MLIDVNIDPRSIDREWLRPLRRVEFEQLAREGAFDDERLELLFGQLVVMSPPDPSHDASVTALTRALITRLGDRASVRTQCAFAASDHSEPLPDIVVCPPGFYWDEHPDHALLVVEVARCSLRKDRTIKAQLYSSVAVDEYWIVDVQGGCMHVLRAPDGEGGWREHRVAHRGEAIALVAFPDVSVDVSAILPPG